MDLKFKRGLEFQSISEISLEINRQQGSIDTESQVRSFQIEAQRQHSCIEDVHIHLRVHLMN